MQNRYYADFKVTVQPCTETPCRWAKNTEPTTTPPVTTAAATTAAPTTTTVSPYVTITSVEYTLANPKDGEIVKITVFAKNDSSTRVDNKPVYVDIGNTRLQGTITIPAGGTGSVTVNDWTASAGTYTDSGEKKFFTKRVAIYFLF